MVCSIEETLKGAKGRIAAGVAALALAVGLYACGSSGVVIGRVNSRGQMIESNDIDCCEVKQCVQRGFDGCRVDGVEVINNIMYQNCHCYSNNPPRRNRRPPLLPPYCYEDNAFLNPQCRRY
jgi:hypothetical protein